MTNTCNTRTDVFNIFCYQIRNTSKMERKISAGIKDTMHNATPLLA